MQTPLKEIVVFHPDPQYLEDVASLKQYIEEELNIRTVSLSNDETACGVKWKVDADWRVLGKKLGKAMPKLKKALPSVTSAEVKSYVETGKITIDGIDLVAGDLTTQRYVELPAGANGLDDVDAAQYTSGSDDDVVILLDIRVRPDFVQEALAREIVNRVQRARKRAGCQATDDMEVYMAFEDAEGKEQLGAVLKEKAEVISRVLKRVPQDDAERNKERKVFWQDSEDQEVSGSKFKLVLLEATA